MEYNQRFTELQPPFIHLAIGAKEDFYNEIWKWRFYNDPNLLMRIVRGKKSLATQNFFDEFSAAFQFPSYFGENWAAFDECINDLDWFCANKYLIFISDANEVLKYDLASFNFLIDILKDTIVEWTEEEHITQVFQHLHNLSMWYFTFQKITLIAFKKS